MGSTVAVSMDLRGHQDRKYVGHEALLIEMTNDRNQKSKIIATSKAEDSVKDALESLLVLTS